MSFFLRDICQLISHCFSIDCLAESRREQVSTAWIQGITALAAFGGGDYGTAVSAFASFAFPGYTHPACATSPAALDSAVLGNSAEQRDVLDEAFMVSLLLSGNARDAQTISLKRTTLRAGISADTLMQALCKHGLFPVDNKQV